MRFDVVFISAALLCLLAGEAMGIWMGTAQDFTYSPVHAHLNLLGWVTLAAYGLLHRAYPALATSRLAGLQCALAILGAVVMPVGIALAMQQNMLPVTVGAFSALAGTLLMGTMFVRKIALARAA